MRRWMAALLALTLLVVAGCASKPAASDSSAAAKPAQPVHLRFLSLAWQKESIQANKDIVDAWNKAHPEIQVEYVQGDWGSVNDYLTTSFGSGDVPDIFHFESASIIDFAKRGYLADLTPLLSDATKKDVLKGAWDSATVDGKIVGFPFLMEPLVIIYNTKMFKDAGVTPPTVDKPWTYDEMRAAAKQLTKDTNGDGKTDTYGVGWGLKSPVSRMMNLSLNYGGQFFYPNGGQNTVKVGDAEKKVMSTAHDMLYTDKTVSPDGLGQTPSQMLPGFYAGKYAMLVGIGAFAREQIHTDGPKDLAWGVLPPLKGDSQNQGLNSQTLSIPAQSKHQKEAAQFLEFALNTENMAKLAAGDWLVPTRQSTIALPQFQTDENGWKVTTAAAKNLGLAPYLFVQGYPEWSSKVAAPAMTDYFNNKITLDQLAQKLQDDGNAILARYH